ncbi:Sec-independent protein translocase protein TatB [compost metagenome]
MFGISFGELLLIALVALLVLGPDRLPGAARTAGLWIGRLKRSFNTIKQEVEREIGADEIRRQLHNENILSMEREAQKLMAPLTGLNPLVDDSQSAQPPAETTPPAAAATPTIAPNSRLNNLPGVGTAPTASPEAVPAAPAEPAAAPQAPASVEPTAPSQPPASSQPASPETPRNP